MYQLQADFTRLKLGVEMHIIQHNPEQKSLVISLPFSPIWLMPNTEVSQEDFREAAAMTNLTPALTLTALNKES